MPIRNKVTTEGGSTGYKMVRSKISKDKFGYGKRVTQARERLMQKLGRDPGVNVVAMHKDFGSHFEKDGGSAKWGSRKANTTESNKHRADKKKKSIRDKFGGKK